MKVSDLMNYPAAKLRGITSCKFLSHNIVTAQQAARYYVTIKKQHGISALMTLITAGILISAVVMVINQTNQLSKPVVSSPKSQQIQITEDPKVQAENIKKYLIAEAALLGVTDSISFYFQDLQKNSQEISFEPTKSWVPASTIKAYALQEAFRQKRLGLVNFDQTVTISADNVVSTELETDEFPRLREGTEATIRQLVEAMIIQSDNTAYNSLLDILDRRNINTSLRNIGITETVVGEKLNLDGDQFQKDLAAPGRQPNTTTVKDLATYFSLLYSHQILDAEEILSIFKRQKINNMIPARLPDNIIVAHKTGNWAPIYHDGGIIYKPNAPFILTVFTSSGDPAVVAKIAQVAYYQDPNYVGKNVALINQPPRQLTLSGRPLYYTDQTEQVLAEQIPAKFPVVTAEDLGITSKDLMPDKKQVSNLNSALVAPGSLLYSIKRSLENIKVTLSFTGSQKARTYLDLANNRLSEIKSLLSQGEVEKSNQLLPEAVDDIKNATEFAKNDPQQDSLLLQIKKTKDLYYAVMSDKAANLPDDKKAQFVDAVYNFYQKEKAEVSPVINSSVIVNPTQQRPTIGVIEKVGSDKLTLKFDDGSTKDVNISSATNVRSADQEVSENINTLKKGTKVAVLGPNGTDTILDAQFILNNIPQGLTDQHQGTVTEIDPNQGTLKVIDQKGQVNLVKIDEDTKLKSLDTDVSLEGVKAGSQVVVFGIPSPIKASSSASPKSGSSPAASGSSQVSPAKPAGSTLPTASSTNTTNGTTTQPKQATLPSPVPSEHGSPSKPVVEIKATSVTVVGNSSGKNEKKESQSNTTQKNPSDNKKDNDKNKK